MLCHAVSGCLLLVVVQVMCDAAVRKVNGTSSVLCTMLAVIQPRYNYSYSLQYQPKKGRPQGANTRLIGKNSHNALDWRAFSRRIVQHVEKRVCIDRNNQHKCIQGAALVR